MKRRWIGLVVCALVAQPFVLAQQSSDAPANKLAYEDGSIANSVYSNECFGFSLPIPEGWQVRALGGAAEGKAMHLPGKKLVLLAMEKHKGESIGARVSFVAQDAKGIYPTAQEFVSNAVQVLVKGDPQHQELLRGAYTVEYAKREFVRSDSKKQIAESAVYQAFVFTTFRGYHVGGIFTAGSQADLDDSVALLQHISFREDQPNSSCVMKEDDPSSGMIAGVISSTPHNPIRVRVSQGVSVGLLIKKVNPQYPADARHAHVQGQVVMQVQIDKNGDVEKVSLVSGDPLLAPAAIEAVKQWKYKPYLLNQQPVAVDTQVIVNFTLSGM
jgi:TonB family protein